MSDQPASPPRLVATDLDGTLLDERGRVSPRTREVLLELDRLGVPVVFVTGRPIRWMDALWEEVGGLGVALLSNGAVVYDVATHSVRSAIYVDNEVALEVADRIREQIPGTAFGVERTSGFALEPAFLARHDKPADIEIGPLDSILDGAVVKLLAQHEEIPAEPFWQQVDQLVGDLVDTTWSSTFALVEMSRSGVTKASALAGLAESLGIEAAEVVAFGDMPNDVAMLQWAGRSYAMSNAHPLAKAAAGQLAPPHQHDGVAEVLSELFGLER